MLMGDNRNAAMAVNALLTPRDEKNPPLCDREVQFFARCFLFGHYDSRGGATLIPAKHLIEAFERYSTSFGWTIENGRLEDPGMRNHFGDDAKYQAWKPDSLHGLLEDDFMFSCSVVICDKEMDPDAAADLDEGFADGDGYKYGLVQYRWLHNHHRTDDTKNELSGWTNLTLTNTTKTLLFWQGEKPVIEPKVLQMDYLPGLEVRVIKKDYGEDACGVVWMPHAE